MNKLSGIIRRITNEQEISLVEIEVSGYIFASLVLESPESTEYLREANKISVIFKETEVSIAKNLNGQISLRNRLESVITSLESGKILSRIVLDFRGNELVSVITKASAERLALKKGDIVEALIKSNEISLMPETYND